MSDQPADLMTNIMPQGGSNPQRRQQADDALEDRRAKLDREIDGLVYQHNELILAGEDPHGETIRSMSDRIDAMEDELEKIVADIELGMAANLAERAKNKSQ